MFMSFCWSRNNSQIVDSLAYHAQTAQELWHAVEREHVCAVAFGFGGVGMGFHEEAVDSDCDSGTGYRFNQVRASACHTGCLIGLLEGVGNVEYDRRSELLHLWNAAIVNDEILDRKSVV